MRITGRRTSVTDVSKTRRTLSQRPSLDVYHLSLPITWCTLLSAALIAVNGEVVVGEQVVKIARREAGSRSTPNPWHSLGSAGLQGLPIRRTSFAKKLTRLVHCTGNSVVP
ncbi:hypothetical protein EJ02DRAFT_7371 [Clathrospora elynae]|uniref:Uncharacterized protein n=1 Tax=Clathrospora elynae TaxID=706981 RepID=A0A6A5T7R4_9PLEO|nr:hypothetical protein EJ02DRAFT_7371 [Clathrospora elynae]